MKKKVRALANYFKGVMVSVSVHIKEGEYIKDVVGFNGHREQFSTIHRNKMCRPKNGLNMNHRKVRVAIDRRWLHHP